MQYTPEDLYKNLPRNELCKIILSLIYDGDHSPKIMFDNLNIDGYISFIIKIIIGADRKDIFTGFYDNNICLHDYKSVIISILSSCSKDYWELMVLNGYIFVADTMYEPKSDIFFMLMNSKK